MSEDKIEQLLKFSNPLKVLYVEDNEESRVSTSGMLENFFGQISVAIDGRDGWEKFRQENFDLIISDINMPQMNGIEMVNKIRELNSDIPILILSAYNESEYFMDTIRMGIDGYLLKPIEFEQFVESIRKIVEKIRLKKENEDYQENLKSRVKEKTDELKYLYYHDALTGLQNRTALLENIDHFQASGLSLIDLNRFSAINDIYGAEIGDKILVGVAKVLAEIADGECSVHRISGDQFVYLNTKCYDLAFCIQKANEVIETIKSTAIKIDVNGSEIEVNLSVTIAVANDMEGSKFLGCADMALNYAKKTYQPLVVYSEGLGLEKHYVDDLKAVSVVKEALKEDRLVPFFQPIIKEDGITYECLARILDDGKVISPFFFIDSIKNTPYYHELTKMMIRKSIDVFRDRPESFSLNLSFEDISNKKIVMFIKEQLAATDIAKRLILEILETEDIEDFSVVRDFIVQMKALGVKVALDDFGSGYSNFSHLIELKPDYIKIDGSLIKNIDKDINSHILSKAIVNFSKEMGIKVIAEYVHSESVYEKVKELDVYGCQGYFFSEPLDVLEPVQYKKEELCGGREPALIET
ncbi:MAG: EAL domain-containing protein [Campylobacterota bacterium]|nr:EAL domain-containing protein [Campylobacterota bacterium]